MHAHLISRGRAEAVSNTEEAAIRSAYFLTRQEGIIPALETAHAFAALDEVKFKESDVVVVNLSGRGDKDLQTYIKYLDHINQQG